MPYPQSCPWATARPDEFPESNRYCTSWGPQGCAKRCARKEHAAQRRKAELAAYRKFPGNGLQQARGRRMEEAVAHLGECPPYRTSDNAPFEEWRAERSRIWAPLRLPAGHCSWCEGQIRDHRKGGVNKRRGWHDGREDEPDCLGLYYAHTRQPDQLAWIVRRDGAWCASCRDYRGAWHPALVLTPEKVVTYGAWWTRRYPPDIYVGEFTSIQLAASLEVDHILPLALVVILIRPERRWRYWGPENLQGLCPACHAAKTKADVRAIKAARVRTP